MTARDLGLRWEDEEWVNPPGDDSIVVSRSGRIVSFRSGDPKELSQGVTNNGYLQSAINGVLKTNSVHRAVAILWKPNSMSTTKNEVNHRDGDKQHNHVDNLEWATRQANIDHSINTGLKGPSPQSKSVRIIETNEVFPSIASAAKSIGASDRNVAMVIYGKRTHTKGKTFEFVGGK